MRMSHRWTVLLSGIVAVMLVTVSSPISAQPPASQAKKPPSGCVVFLVDSSESVKEERDWSQALVTQAVFQAQLAQENLELAVIFFGGFGVQVHGPSAAYAQLHRKLDRDWPQPKGATPLDQAFAEAVRIVRDLPRDTPVTIVVFTDGLSNSGKLREGDFPEVKAAIDQAIRRDLAKIPSASEAFQKQLEEQFRRLIREFRSPHSVPIYRDVQLPLEHKRTLEHAATLKTASARFILVDYHGVEPRLQEIHEKASDSKEDFILAQPAHTVVAKLQQRGLLPANQRVFSLSPQKIDAQPLGQAVATPIALDRTAEAAVVTAVFNAPLVTDSGAQFSIRLPGYVVSVLKDERLALSLVYETTTGEAEPDGATKDARHPDFGEIGDEATECKVVVFVRSDNVDYPLSLKAAVIDLSDCTQTPLTQPWITVQPPAFTLSPDKAVKLILRVRMPEVVQDNLRDGVVEGKLVFTRDDGTEMPLVRGDDVANVPKDAPVDTVSFTLRRPEFAFSLPRCLRTNILHQDQGQLAFRPAISIGVPFAETYTLRVRTTSKLTRTATVSIEPLFHNKKGQTIPTVLLTVDEGTRDVPPDAYVEYPLQLKVGEDDHLTEGSLRLVISAPGVRTQVLNIEFSRRHPLLGPSICNVLFVAAAIGLLAAWPFLRRLLRARRYRVGAQHELSEGQLFAGLFSTSVKKERVRLDLKQDCNFRLPGDMQLQRKRSGSRIDFPAADLATKGPALLEAVQDDGPANELEVPLTVAIVDMQPDANSNGQCVLVEVEAAGEFACEAAFCVRRLWLCVITAGLLLGAACTLHTPTGLRVAQWLFDFVTL